jgi:hypothetical protein
MTHRLVREHEQQLPAGSVIRCVARCCDELVQMGVRVGLVDAVEAMSRRRLRDRVTPPHTISAVSTGVPLLAWILSRPAPGRTVV